MAVVSCVGLLAVDITPFLSTWSKSLAYAGLRSWALIKTVPLSAPPLLLVGSSYILLQAINRPRPFELLKRLMLGAAFLLWGITQFMPVSALSIELGNVVIALYVIDLALMIWTELKR